MTRVLLIGYGRAGRRLARGLDALGVEWTPVDPDFENRDKEGRLQGLSYYLSLDDALYDHFFTYDFAIIATPPSLHLPQIKSCLDAGLPCLCEKPLCDWGQLPEAEALLSHPLAGKVGMTLNYRWHPTIQSLIATRPQWQYRDSTPYTALSIQHRERLPEWGLILDHLPHTVDLFLYLSGAERMTVDTTLWTKNLHIESVFSCGWLDGRRWSLRDSVYSHPIDKEGWIEGPMGKAVIETPPEVVDQMTGAILREWIGFIKGENSYRAILEDGVRVQRVLEAVKEGL